MAVKIYKDLSGFGDMMSVVGCVFEGLEPIPDSVLDALKAEVVEDAVLPNHLKGKKLRYTPRSGNERNVDSPLPVLQIVEILKLHGYEPVLYGISVALDEATLAIWKRLRDAETDAHRRELISRFLAGDPTVIFARFTDEPSAIKAAATYEGFAGTWFVDKFPLADGWSWGIFAEKQTKPWILCAGGNPSDPDFWYGSNNGRDFRDEASAKKFLVEAKPLLAKMFPSYTWDVGGSVMWFYVRGVHREFEKRTAYAKPAMVR